MVVAIIYLIGKYEINAVSFFAPTKTIFKMGIAVFIASVVSYISLVFIPSIEGALLQRILSWGAASVMAIYLFRTRRDNYYNNIYS